ncbi:hypothetical protein ACIP93_36030 [Streptomyces sp. NPDC088745]|uniref:hypothetical protein n=1 Tax=Streptomyces sp. NPDC088745 TaxID=3365884 RepID=UPI0037F29467
MHSQVRTAAGTAALAAALLLTGCSGDSGKDDGPDGRGGPPGSARSSTPSPGAGDGGGASTPPARDTGSGAGAGSVDGEWAVTTGGKMVALSIHDGLAGIAGENICTGTVSRRGAVTLDLSCANGRTDRARGTVTPGADGKTLTVKWEGSGVTETFTRAPSSALPSGVPTGPPSDPPKP